MHIARIHRDIISCSPTHCGSRTKYGYTGPPSDGESSHAATNSDVCLDNLSEQKARVNVLKLIPNGGRNLAEKKLCSINVLSCLLINSVENWFSLLSFSFSALLIFDIFSKLNSGTPCKSCSLGLVCSVDQNVNFGLNF